jgi:hypothetical protein
VHVALLIAAHLCHSHLKPPVPIEDAAFLDDEMPSIYLLASVAVIGGNSFSLCNSFASLVFDPSGRERDLFVGQALSKLDSSEASAHVDSFDKVPFRTFGSANLGREGWVIALVCYCSYGPKSPPDCHMFSFRMIETSPQFESDR